MLLDPRRQGTGPVRLVGEHLGQAGHPSADPLEHLHGPVPVGRGRRQHRQAPDQPERIDQEVPLAAADLLPPVVSFGPPASVVLTLWLSMIARLGVGSLPAAARISARNIE